MKEEWMETDVLCVGGGIAGLMAAIRASEHGAKVIVADKSNTLHSGNGGGGNDHFLCYIPEVHGPDINPIVEGSKRSLAGGWRHVDFIRTWLENTFDIVKLWDSWGIPMKYKGRWEFAGHGLPGRPLLFLHYNGQEQKKVLTQEALKRGVRIVNRVMTLELVSDGRIQGAIGVNTREDKVYMFQAKSVVLATGACVRLYRSPVPGWMFNVAYSPSVTGDGQAMAYRAGAELSNLELPRRWVGPRYFARCGKGTWIGVLRDPQDKAVGPFATKPDRKYGDVAADIYTGLFADYFESGKGPVYMDCKGISEEDYDYMLHFFKHEGLSSLIRYMEEEGIDPRKNPIEFGTYEMQPKGGVYHNEKGETSTKGLFTAGDEAYSSGGISVAATYGWLIGEEAAKQAKEADSPGSEKAKEEIAKSFLTQIKSREAGPDWREVNITLQQIMDDYAGANRSESLLRAGAAHLQRLKEKARASMIAGNQHEMMHCLEVLNLLDVGEVLFFAANERNETRDLHIRTDYPFTNPLMEGFLIVKQEDGKPSARWETISR